MGLIIYNQKNEIEESDKIFYDYLSKNLINHRSIKLKNQNNEYLNLTQHFSFSHTVWFAKYQKNNEIIYYFGDKNHQSVLNNTNSNNIQPNFSIIFNTEEFRKDNGRFAKDNKDIYVLLYVDLTNPQISTLKSYIPIVKFKMKNSEQSKYFFKINMENFLETLDLIIKMISFQDPLSKNLTIKTIKTDNSTKNSQEKKPNNKILKDSKPNEENLEIKPDKNEDSNFITCDTCGKKLRKNEFYKLSNGKYTKTCKKCSEKQIAAKYLKEVLKYIKPEELIKPDKLKDNYSSEKLKEAIYTFIENDLEKKDNLTGTYKLESENTINNFLEKYKPKNIEQKFSLPEKDNVQSTENIPSNREDNEDVPPKKSNGQYSLHKGITYNKPAHKWVAINREKGSNKLIGYFESEEEAYQARKDYLNTKKSQKVIQTDKKENNNQNENSENSNISYFVNYLGDQSEILMRGTLKNEEAFKFVTQLTPINSEIKKVLIDNNDKDSDILIEIRLKRYNLTYIMDFLKKLGCTPKNLS